MKKVDSYLCYCIDKTADGQDTLDGASGIVTHGALGATHAANLGDVLAALADDSGSLGTGDDGPHVQPVCLVLLGILAVVVSRVGGVARRGLDRLSFEDLGGRGHTSRRSVEHDSVALGVSGRRFGRGSRGIGSDGGRWRVCRTIRDGNRRRLDGVGVIVVLCLVESWTFGIGLVGRTVGRRWLLERALLRRSDRRGWGGRHCDVWDLVTCSFYFKCDGTLAASRYAKSVGQGFFIRRLRTLWGVLESRKRDGSSARKGRLCSDCGWRGSGDAV